MAAIENFVLKIKVEGQKAVDDLSKSVTNLGTTMNGFGAYAGKMTSAISGIVGGLGGMASIAGTAATAFVGLGLRAISLADDLSDISDSTGIATGALNNFKNSLVDAGGKTEDFSTLAAKLNQNVGDAAVGNEKAQQAFRKLGVFVTDAGGAVRNTGDILRDAIARLAAIEDPATRAAMAVDIFGKTANKLDFTKLNAANDFAKDEQIAQLAKYQTAIDAISKSINDNLVASFGKIAIAIDDAQKKAKKAEDEANARGNTTLPQPGATGPAAGVVNPFGVGGAPAGERQMTAKEKAQFEQAKKLTEAYKDQGREMAKLQSLGKTQATTGGFGATPEATLKAVAESEKRLRESNIASNRNIALKGANEIQAIEINAASEIAKARETIFAQERLTDQQKGAEFVAKRKEIQTKADSDIAKARSQLNAKIFSEEEAQRQKIAEELAAEEKRVNDIVAASAKVVDEIANQNKELATKAKFSLDSATMTDTERANAQQLFDIEQQRLDLLRQIADIKDLPYAERLAREKAVNDLLNQRRNDAIVTQQQQQTQREDFNAGWEKSYRQYVENSRNAAEQSKNYFDTFTRGFEDAFVKMVQTGKLSFKDLANSLIADFARIQAKKALLGIFDMGGANSSGSGFSFGTLFGSIGKIFGFANGGNPPVNRPSIVGERGPELFVPRTAGTIVPNGGFGGQTVNTAVTYNIQAVDASSFRSLIARDPEFIHNVSEQGRRSLPIRSRR